MTEHGRIHTDGSRSGGQPVLEPCPVPWCGSSDVKARSFDANHRRHWIECGKCNFKTPQMPSRTKVITLWNTRQPTHSNIFDASDVQKHTLIVDQDYASHTIKVKSLKDSQPTQSDALRDQLLQECLVKLRDVQGMEAPKQYACNLIKRIERVLQGQSK